MSDSERHLNLFVYGTLRTGQPLAGWLTSITSETTPGYIKGKLYPTHRGFPIADTTEEGIIVGEVKRCKVSMQLLACIDMEKAAGYELVSVPLLNEFGQYQKQKVATFHFPYRKPIQKHIESGDWIVYQQQQKSFHWKPCTNCGILNKHVCVKAGKPHIHNPAGENA